MPVCARSRVSAVPVPAPPCFSLLLPFFSAPCSFHKISTELPLTAGVQACKRASCSVLLASDSNLFDRRGSPTETLDGPQRSCVPAFCTQTFPHAAGRISGSAAQDRDGQLLEHSRRLNPRTKQQKEAAALSLAALTAADVGAAGVCCRNPLKLFPVYPRWRQITECE